MFPVRRKGLYSSNYSSYNSLSDGVRACTPVLKAVGRKQIVIHVLHVGAFLTTRDAVAAVGLGFYLRALVQ